MSTPPAQTYILTNPEATAQVEVVPERGGIITRWRVDDQEILYLDAARFADPQLSVRGGIPILFPICGNLPEDRYTYGGQTFQLPQHGFARNLPWQVGDQTPNRLTVILNSTPATLSQYPFEFQLALTYVLTDRTLDIHQRVTNRSAVAMPFSIGFHPYFLAPDKSSLSFDLPATRAWEKGAQQPTTFAGEFDFTQPEIDLALYPLSSRSATVCDRSRQLSLGLTYDALFTTLVFWSVQGKDFYCLEPWSAPRNALNTGENLIQLPAAATLETTVTLHVSSLLT